MDNFKLLSIIAVRKTAINKEMYAQIKANSRTETQYDIVERINAVLEASRDVSEGYGAKKRQAVLYKPHAGIVKFIFMIPKSPKRRNPL